MKQSNLISLLLLTALLASCGGTAEQTDTTGTSADAESTEPVETELSDDLPARDFGGYEFRLFTNDADVVSYVPETENGEIVNDAVYRRNRSVEERFNVKITAVSSGAVTGAAGETAHRKSIETRILAGDDAFDLALGNGKQLCGASLGGIFLNLHDLTYVNFDKPWWSEQLVDSMTYRNCLFIGSSNLHYNEFAGSMVFYFNKELIDRYNIDNPYQTVFDNKWTFDKMASLTKDTYEDLNGNSEADNEDLYGMLITYTQDTWHLTLDIPVWEKHDDSIELVANNPKAADAFDMVYKWFFESSGVKSVKGAENAILQDMFKNNKGLFIFGMVGDAGNVYRDSNVEYGLLPYPKYDENQENYKVFFNVNGASMFAVPVTTQDAERTGIILEALSAEGYKQVTPVYYEIALKDKYLQDTESVQMLDLITSNRTITFSYCYDNYAEACLGFGMAFSKGHESFASYYASMENVVRARIELVERAFMKN